MERPPSLGVYRVEERALRPPTVPNGNVPPGIFPGTVGEDVDTPGDDNGFEVVSDGPPVASFATLLTPSPWSGYPGGWQTPQWDLGPRYGELVDTAWAGIDLNASILSTMPVYCTDARGRVIPSPEWMTNPDPDLYTSWEEFAKQFAWDYHLGEAFVLATAYRDGLPARFHVVEPHMVNVDMDSGRRRYRIGAIDVTADILHVRYKSTTSDARGHGPLDAGAGRIVAAGVLARYATDLARIGGVPQSVIKAPGNLTQKQADDLLAQWWQSRIDHLGLPAVLSGGVEIETLQLSPKDMALVELAQFNESRIAVLLGVPPFLLGLPSGGDSMTYTTVSALFDYHWRAGLRTKAGMLMPALSQWALTDGERAELNRDEYVRPGFGERASAYSVLHGIEDATGRAITAAEIRGAERLNGETANTASAVLTGGN